jgi:hypothetical protein
LRFLSSHEDISSDLENSCKKKMGGNNNCNNDGGIEEERSRSGTPEGSFRISVSNFDVFHSAVIPYLE